MKTDFEYTDYKSLVEYIKTLADEPYLKMQKRLVPGEENIYGVRVPKLRMLAKQISKSNWHDYLNDAQDNSLEENMLHGLVIGYAKMNLDEQLSCLKKFIPKINNWAVCDTCCSNLKFTLKNKEPVFEFLKPYIKSKNEFDVRFAAVMLMDFYITDEYIDKVIKIYDGIKNEGYYAKMAVAWGLSVCFVKYSDITMKYLNNNNLNDWTYNKALQKITESFRVDDDTKKIIRKMKRMVN